MKCPKCGSENVNVQAVTETQVKNARHGCAWWLFVGWWWLPVKWICFFVPALIVKIFGHKKVKVESTQKTMCVCQSCGHSWEA